MLMFHELVVEDASYSSLQGGERERDKEIDTERERERDKDTEKERERPS